MRILCIGVSHKTAEVALRERVAFDAPTRTSALAQLADRWPSAEMVILSTCNRTEVYTVRPVHAHPREHELRQWLCEFHSVDAGTLGESLYKLADAEAVRHLVRVAAGLDSLVAGEGQITAQVKDAYAAACQAGTAKSVMNVLLQAAIRAAKQVRAKTGIGAGGRSVASVAIDCAVESLDQLDGKCVLCIGAGKTSELMLRRLSDLGAGRVMIANRSAQRAAELAERFGGEAVGLTNLAEHLSAADVVLSSTASDSPIITRSMVAEAQTRRGGKELLIVDIAVPRDVEHQAGELDSVFLYDMDDLQRLVAARSAGSDEQRAAARAIVDEHVKSILQRLKIREVAPTIDAMYRYMRRIADQELDAAVNKLATHDDAEQDRQVLSRALRRTVRRILHPAVQNLRKASAADAAGAQIAALRKLFNLDADEE